MIKTDTTNVLIRALQQKFPAKPRPEARPSSKETSLKRPIDEALDAGNSRDDSPETESKRARPLQPSAGASVPPPAAAASLKAPSVVLPPIPASGLHTLTKTQLSHILRAYNLPVSGSKVRGAPTFAASLPSQEQLVARVRQLQSRREQERAGPITGPR